MKGEVDVAGLRRVESAFSLLAGVIDQAMKVDPIALDVVFVVVGFDYEGAGTTWVSNERDRARIQTLIRDEAARLRVSEPGVKVFEVQASAVGATREQMGALVDELGRLATLIGGYMPTGWGFGLLIRTTDDTARGWIASGDRSDTPALLDEMADTIGTPFDHPPGTLGRAH